MAYAEKFLADGQIASSEGDLYIPAGVTAMLTQVTLSNTNTTDELVKVYLKPSGGTSREIWRGTLSANESMSLKEIVSGCVLETGDAIRAVTTTASKVDFTVHGVEKT